MSQGKFSSARTSGWKFRGRGHWEEHFANACSSRGSDSRHPGRPEDKQVDAEESWKDKRRNSHILL